MQPLPLMPSTLEKVTLRLTGTIDVVAAAVAKVLRARSEILADGGVVGAIVLVFDSLTDPTFAAYSTRDVVGRAGDGSFVWRGVQFQVAAAR